MLPCQTPLGVPVPELKTHSGYWSCEYLLLSFKSLCAFDHHNILCKRIPHFNYIVHFSLLLHFWVWMGIFFMILPLSLSLVLTKRNKQSFSIYLCLTYFGNFKTLVWLSLSFAFSPYGKQLPACDGTCCQCHIGKSLTRYKMRISPISGFGTRSVGEGRRGNTLLVLTWLCKVPQS